MTLHTFSSGEVLTSSNLNSNFGTYKIQQVYTGTGFNTTQAGAGTNTASYEMSAITNPLGADYAIVEVRCTSMIDINSDLRGSTKLIIDIKEIGGAYSTAFSEYLVNWDAPSTKDWFTMHNPRFIITLTAGQKANGFQIKITSESYAEGTGDTALTNNQTTLLLAA
jgi:hypothetical protein